MYACVYMRGFAPVLRLLECDTEHTIADLKDKQIEIIALMNSWVFSRLIAENERAGESLAHPAHFVFSPSFAVTFTWFSALALGTRTDNFFSLTGMVERMRIQLENCVSNIRAALAALSRAVM